MVSREEIEVVSNERGDFHRTRLSKDGLQLLVAVFTSDLRLPVANAAQVVEIQQWLAEQVKP